MKRLFTSNSDILVALEEIWDLTRSEMPYAFIKGKLEDLAYKTAEQLKEIKSLGDCFPEALAKEVTKNTPSLKIKGVDK